ncbi:hypothetical protein HanIR_Chr03g0119921 [Helianthus annuus]|nr:hypothetical protein HanIR_Chr03g0119921 [Helianthus annuus]
MSTGIIITLYVLQNLIFRKINLLQCFSDLFLPQRYEFIERVDVSRRLDIHDLVECSWIIHSFNGVCSNVMFIIVNSCDTTR